MRIGKAGCKILYVAGNNISIRWTRTWGLKLNPMVLQLCLSGWWAARAALRNLTKRDNTLSDGQRGNSNFPVVLVAAARERAGEALFSKLLDGLSFATAAEFQAGLNNRISGFYDNCHNFGSHIGRLWRRFSQESPPVFRQTSRLKAC
jgi:hypothetical protein